MGTSSHDAASDEDTVALPAWLGEGRKPEAGITALQLSTFDLEVPS
jgi:hypothetical protein